MKTTIIPDNRYTIEFEDLGIRTRMVICEGKEEFVTIQIGRNGEKEAANLKAPFVPFGDQISPYEIDRLIGLLTACKEHLKEAKKNAK